MFQSVIRRKLQITKGDAMYMYFKNNRLYSSGKTNFMNIHI